MRYLIDSDLVVDWLNGHPSSVTFLTPLFSQGMALSILTYSEIFEGIYGGQDPRREQIAFQAFLRSLKVLSITRAVARRNAQLRRHLRDQRRPLVHRALDLLIAATALEYGLVLLTRNRKDYTDVPGLTILSP
ncbi:MAG TPA: type II toxin-antitoxin system VapC family toxin [Chloroflexota bacterium]|nr:type II toxin-antitoxin system VapC family toxin [Chloroflexota bacterium]